MAGTGPAAPSTGLGWGGGPPRHFCPPMIVLHLVKRAPRASPTGSGQSSVLSLALSSEWLSRDSEYRSSPRPAHRGCRDPLPPLLHLPTPLAHNRPTSNTWGPGPWLFPHPDLLSSPGHPPSLSPFLSWVLPSGSHIALSSLCPPGPGICTDSIHGAILISLFASCPALS